MSEGTENQNIPPVDSDDKHDGPSSGPLSGEEPESSLQRLRLYDHEASASSLSPPAEASGLLSLPWELIAYITSYLSASCIINVLPKVCQALSNVCKDNAALQLRARRLVGSGARFPVQLREDIDWQTVCLEMEQLVACWLGLRHFFEKQKPNNEEERRGVLQPPVVEMQNQENAFQEFGPGDEEMEIALEAENGEFPPAVEDDLMAGLQEWEERADVNVEDPIAGVMNDEEQQRVGNHQDDFALIEGVRGDIDVELLQKSLALNPELDHLTLHSEHIAPINCVLLLGGEGAICATGSRDWEVKLWDLKRDLRNPLLLTMRGEGQFSSHQGWVWCLASQGSWLASGSFDATIRQWDLQACGAERGLIRTGAGVFCLTYHREFLLAGTVDKRVNMYDLRAAEPLVKSLRPPRSNVMCLAADDNYIICGSKDGNLSVYDSRTNAVLGKCQLSSYLRCMSYADGEVWGGDSRGTIHSFSVQSCKLKSLSRFGVGHTAMVTGIHKSPGSLYTCSFDSTVKIHIPSAPPKTLCTLRHKSAISGLSVEAGVLAVASGETCVEVWKPHK
ncbi:F-box/WD repeat-containing protein 9 [Synchiropus picturatus]